MSGGDLLPTLGWQVIRWCHRSLALNGSMYRMPREHQALTLRVFEVWPQGHPREGRRVWTQAYIELIKNLGKSTLAGAWASCELAGPTRFDGWDRDGNPVAVPVRDPLVICFGVSEDAASTTYTKARRLLADGPLGVQHGGRIDDGEEVIRVLGRSGAITKVTAKMKSKVGSDATMVVRDEPGIWVTPEHRALAQEARRMIDKRAQDDSYLVDTTNAWVPGQQSVAEQVSKGGPGVLVHRRGAPDGMPTDTREQRRAALRAATGPDYPWNDEERLLDAYEQPDTDKDEWKRWYLGWRQADELSFMRPDEWEAAGRPDQRLVAGDDIVVFFDGSDAVDDGDWTVLLAVRISDGLAWPLGVWHDLVRRDASIADRQAWRAGVTLRVRATFASYRVHRMYCDPPGWWEEIGGWASEFGAERVREWPTGTTPGTRRLFAQAVEAVVVAARNGALIHPDNPALNAHVSNARRWPGPGGDVIGKEHKDSAKKVDLAVALVGGWQARLDELANPTNLDEPDYVQAFY